MSEDCLVLKQTINSLVAENADKNICVTYTEMYLLLELKELEDLTIILVIEDDTEYSEITYKGFKIRAQG